MSVSKALNDAEKVPVREPFLVFLASWAVARPFFFFFFKFIYLFIYLWLCWVFVAARGLSLVVVRGLFIAVASLVAEHGL